MIVRLLSRIMATGRLRTRSLRVQELPEAFTVLIEQRLGARHVDRHGHDVAARSFAVLAQIDLRHRQRVFDHRPRSRRKPAVKPAVESDARDNRHQDRRHGGDDREQPHDAHMKASARPAPPAGLHDVPDFTGDDREQDRDGGGVDQQDGDDDLVRSARSASARSRRGRSPARKATRCRRQSGRSCPWPDGSAARQRPFLRRLRLVLGLPCRRSVQRRTTQQLMLLYNNVAELRQFHGGVSLLGKQKRQPLVRTT